MKLLALLFVLLPTMLLAHGEFSQVECSGFKSPEKPIKFTAKKTSKEYFFDLTYTDTKNKKWTTRFTTEDTFDPKLNSLVDHIESAFGDYSIKIVVPESKLNLRKGTAVITNRKSKKETHLNDCSVTFI